MESPVPHLTQRSVACQFRPGEHTDALLMVVMLSEVRVTVVPASSLRASHCHIHMDVCPELTLRPRTSY